MDKKVVVLGSGQFGTCLAQVLADTGYPVVIWSRFKEVAASINQKHSNPEGFPQQPLHKNITATATLDLQLLADAYLIIIAVPTQFVREVLNQVKGFIQEKTILVCAAKGIENQTLCLPLEIIAQTLGSNIAENTVVLSGPSFASEVMELQPTAVSLASRSSARCLEAQEVFHAPHFRAYTSKDPVGLEVAGALKNVIAIASGACEGLGYQMNAQAALVTRGLAELTRIGVKLGAQPLSFVGLGGVGDLFLTCYSQKSRNYRVGFHMAKGESLDQVLKSLGSVAEGVTTAKAAYQLAQKLQVDAPITDVVYKVLYEGKSIGEAVQTLLMREAKPEIT